MISSCWEIYISVHGCRSKGVTHSKYTLNLVIAYVSIRGHPLGTRHLSSTVNVNLCVYNLEGELLANGPEGQQPALILNKYITPKIVGTNVQYM